MQVRALARSPSASQVRAPRSVPDAGALGLGAGTLLSCGYSVTLLWRSWFSPISEIGQGDVSLRQLLA